MIDLHPSHVALRNEIAKERATMNELRAQVAEKDKYIASLEKDFDAHMAVIGEKDKRVATLEREKAALRSIGERMANLCFNGKQRTDVPLSYRANMAQLQKEWDAALAFVRGDAE